MRIYKNIKWGIKNCIKWFPVVWNDRDFDWSYLAIVMQFKINNMANFIEHNKFYAGYKRDVRDMRVCVELLDRLIEDDTQDVENKKLTFTQYEQRISQWQRMVGEILGKRMRKWWE